MKWILGARADTERNGKMKKRGIPTEQCPVG